MSGCISSECEVCLRGLIVHRGIRRQLAKWSLHGDVQFREFSVCPFDCPFIGGNLLIIIVFVIISIIVIMNLQRA